MRKKAFFRPMKNLFLFSSAQTEKKLVEKLGENMW